MNFRMGDQTTVYPMRNFRNKTYWLYANRWGRDKKQIIASRVGVKAPARFLCTAEEDSVSEIAEVTQEVKLTKVGYVREGDVVIVERILRFARNTKELLELVEQLTAQKEALDTFTPRG